MKITEKKKPIDTIPTGVWESSRKGHERTTTLTPTTDLQGNGYPVQKQNNDVVNNKVKKDK